MAITGIKCWLLKNVRHLGNPTLPKWPHSVLVTRLSMTLVSTFTPTSVLSIPSAETTIRHLTILVRFVALPPLPVNLMVTLTVKTTVRPVKTIRLVLRTTVTPSRLALFRCSNSLVTGRTVTGNTSVWLRCRKFLTKHRHTVASCGPPPPPSLGVNAVGRFDVLLLCRVILVGYGRGPGTCLC